jgi:hypothetical protein
MTRVESGDVLDVAAAVGEALERLAAGWFLGGSLASSLQGDPRTTLDIDIVTDLPAGSAARFAEELGADFDVDVAALAEGLRQRRSWNIYYLPEFMKVDVFGLAGGAFDRSEFDRRRKQILSPGRHLWLKTPEDSIVRKLLWYEQGERAASHQWRDVIGILRANPGMLDTGYIQRWTKQLGLTELWIKAAATAS